MEEDARPAEAFKPVGIPKRIILFLRCYWRSLVVLLTPLVLIPIIHVSEDKFTLCVYVICLMAIWWVTEAIPFAITSLLPVILFPVLGILNMSECCASFISDFTITFLGTFIVGQAFEYCLLDQRIALTILKKMGCRPILLHNILVMTTFLCSMWIIDMAVVAVMCPIVKAILHELDAHGLCRQFAGKSSEGSPRPSKTALCFYMGVSMAAIFGGCSTPIGTGANAVMVQMYTDLFGRSVTFAAFSIYAFPVMLVMVVFSTLYLQWRFLGLFRKNDYGECVVMTKETLQQTRENVDREYKLMGPLVFHEKLVLGLFCLMIVLLVTRKPGIFLGWDYGFFNGGVTEATISTFIFILLIAMPSHTAFLNYFKQNSDYLPLRMSRGAISWNFIRAKVPWKIIFLMGGGLMLAEGSRVTQISYHIANYSITLRHCPKILVSFVYCLPVFLLTQVLGNSPLAYISLPIIVDLAQCHQIHPLYFMVPVTLICSLALTTPAGTGANALVVGFANIRAIDVAQTGALPALISFFLVWGSFPLYGRLLFPEIDEVHERNGTSTCVAHPILK